MAVGEWIKKVLYCIVFIRLDGRWATILEKVPAGSSHFLNVNDEKINTIFNSTQIRTRTTPIIHHSMTSEIQNSKRLTPQPSPTGR